MGTSNQAIDHKLLAATLCDLRRARDLITDQGAALDDHWEEISSEEREEVDFLASRLDQGHVQLLGIQDDRFPIGLKSLRTPPPYLFAVGNLDLLNERAIGFSGSRDATEVALEATATCAREAHEAGFVVVAGFARGVDGVAHQAAIAAGGSTIAVLPEGILSANLRISGEYEDSFPGENFLAISQFQAEAKWMVGRAMTRNTTVIAISECLVLMSAGETGGSYEAGKAALKANSPVVTPAFEEDLSPGAKALGRTGAVAIDSIDAFRKRLGEMASSEPEVILTDEPGTLF